MKRLAFKAALGIFVAASIFTSQAQNIGVIRGKAQTAAAGISVSTSNGKTTIVYKGKEVWSGKTTGKVFGKSKVIGDVEYVAAFDGEKVLWQNVPGAAGKVK